MLCASGYVLVTGICVSYSEVFPSIIIPVILILVTTLYFALRQRTDPEEIQIVEAANRLRVKLAITKRDGFLVGAEGGYFSSLMQWQQMVIIRTPFMDAAARLSLYKDFDVHHFDVLCAYLQDREPQQTNLRTWVLEVCEFLLDPAEADTDYYKSSTDKAESLKKITQSLRRQSDASGDDVSLHSMSSLPERFQYFQRRVSKIQLWREDDGVMFKSLQTTAEALMVKTARYCFGVSLTRAANMAPEDGGVHIRP